MSSAMSFEDGWLRANFPNTPALPAMRQISMQPATSKTPRRTIKPGDPR